MTRNGQLDVTPVDSVSDDELCALALAADPETAVPDDAVCLWDVTGSGVVQVLPEWYMPSPMPGPRKLTGWRRNLARVNVGLIIVSFLTINAAGLCNTYGQLHF
jgi:hypothetical protein